MSDHDETYDKVFLFRIASGEFEPKPTNEYIERKLNAAFPDVLRKYGVNMTAEDFDAIPAAQAKWKDAHDVAKREREERRESRALMIERFKYAAFNHLGIDSHPKREVLWDIVVKSLEGDSVDLWYAEVYEKMAELVVLLS